MYAGVIVWPKHIGPPNMIDFEKLTRIPYVFVIPKWHAQTQYGVPPKIHRTHAIPVTEAPPSIRIAISSQIFLL